MKTKEIKLNIPEDWEIDDENSTVDCIKLKPSEKETIGNNKYITMQHVYEHLKYDENGQIKFYSCTSYLDEENEIHSYDYSIYNNIHTRNAKLAAYAALSDIAEYYNDKWIPDFDNWSESKYYIYYNNEDFSYEINADESVNRGLIYFKNYVDAQEVINNPNFRNILNTLLI